MKARMMCLTSITTNTSHMSMSRDLKDNLKEHYAQIKDFIYQKYKHQDQDCTKILGPLHAPAPCHALAAEEAWSRRSILLAPHNEA